MAHDLPRSPGSTRSEDRMNGRLHLYHCHSTPASVKIFLWLPQVGLDRYTLVPLRNLAMKSAPTLRDPVPERDWTHAMRFCRGRHKGVGVVVCHGLFRDDSVDSTSGLKTQGSSSSSSSS